MKRTRDAVVALLAFVFWVGVFVLSSFAEDMRPLTTMKLGHYAVIWITNGSIMLGALLVFFIDQFIQGLIKWRKVGVRALRQGV